MPGFLGPLSLGLDAIGGITKLITGLHQNHLANQINPIWNQYQISPFEKQELGTAQQLYNGRMPGAAAEEQNIGASQANYLNNVDRNATDSGQALALGGLSQGQSNQAYSNLQTKELQSKNDFLNNLNTAYQGMIGEGNKVYQSQLEKYQSDVAAKTALRGAGAQNFNSALNDLGSTAFLGNYENNNPNNVTNNTRTGQSMQAY